MTILNKLPAKALQKLQDMVTPACPVRSRAKRQQSSVCIKVCAMCGKEFATRQHARKYCSADCRRRAGAKANYLNLVARWGNYSHKGYLAKEIVFNYGERCAICGWQATPELIEVNGRKQWAHGNDIHHIVPASEGGLSDYENLILLCPNHHKMAHMGLLSREELKRYLRYGLSAEDKFARLKTDMVNAVQALAR